jgi:hypothetical protein
VLPNTVLLTLLALVAAVFLFGGVLAYLGTRTSAAAEQGDEAEEALSAAPLPGIHRRVSAADTMTTAVPPATQWRSPVSGTRSPRFTGRQLGSRRRPTAPLGR